MFPSADKCCTDFSSQLKTRETVSLRTFTVILSPSALIPVIIQGTCALRDRSLQDPRARIPYVLFYVPRPPAQPRSGGPSADQTFWGHHTMVQSRSRLRDPVHLLLITEGVRSSNTSTKFSHTSSLSICCFFEALFFCDDSSKPRKRRD